MQNKNKYKFQSHPELFKVHKKMLGFFDTSSIRKTTKNEIIFKTNKPEPIEKHFEKIGLKLIKLSIVLLFFTLQSCGSKAKKIDIFKNMELIDNVLLDTKVVIKKDTFDIINTDWWNLSVKLDNGITYKYKYIEKFLPKKTLKKIDSINNLTKYK